MDRKTIPVITGGILLAVILIIISVLTFFELPETNRNIITMLIGAIAASIPTAVIKFLGDDPQEIKDLKEKVKSITEDYQKCQTEHEKEVLALKTRIDTLRQEMDDLKTRFINKLNWDETQ